MKKIRKAWIAMLGIAVSSLVFQSCHREEPMPIEKYGIPEVLPMYGVPPTDIPEE